MSRPAGLAFDIRDSCPACGSTDTVARFDCRFDEPPIAPFLADYYGLDPSWLDGRYRAEQCRSCASWFQAEVGNPALLERLYADWVFDVGDPMNDPLYAFDMAHPRQSRDGHEAMAAAAVLGLDLAGLRTLDYGMGWASWARVAAMLGCQSHGHDLAPDRMAFAAGHGIAPHAPGNQYHFINAEQVFEHLPDPRGTIAMLAEALLPGGILKISLPSPRGLAEALAALTPGRGKADAGAIMPLHPLEHVNCFSRAGLSALGKSAGLAVHPPPVAASFAFLRHAGSLDPANPRKAAKELVRPFYQRLNPRNHLVWMRKAG